MNLTGNTIFITGGGSGIGRGIAEAFHRLGNQVIISGRRKRALEETIKANPGMASIELDIENPASIQAGTKRLTTAYPGLNVLINNAGIMLPDTAAEAQNDAQLVSTVTTKLYWAASRNLRVDRTPEGPVIGNDHLQHFVPRLCSDGRNLRVLGNKGGAPLLCTFAAVQVAQYRGEGHRTGSALGTNRSDEQPRSRSRDAAR